MDLAVLPIMGTWEMALLGGAAALAVGLHAWRQLQARGQAGTGSAGSPESAQGLAEPLLSHSQSKEPDGPDSTLGTDLDVSTRQPQQPEVAAGSTSSPAPLPAAGKAATEGTALSEQAGAAPGEEVAAAPGEAAAAAATAAPAVDAAASSGSSRHDQSAEQPPPVPQQQAAGKADAAAAALQALAGLPQEQPDSSSRSGRAERAAEAAATEGVAAFLAAAEGGEQAAEAAAEAGRDPSDLPPAAAAAGLGSPFIPPSLGAAPTAGGQAAPPPGIPLFSSFVPRAPAPPSLEGDAGGAVEVAAAASPAGSGSLDVSSGSSPSAAAGGDDSSSSASAGPSPQQPRHRRKRSLLSGQLQASGAAAMPAEGQVAQNEQRGLAGQAPAAPEAVAAAAAAAEEQSAGGSTATATFAGGSGVTAATAAPSSSYGRPGQGLRVDVPAEEEAEDEPPTPRFSPSDGSGQQQRQRNPFGQQPQEQQAEEQEQEEKEGHNPFRRHDQQQQDLWQQEQQVDVWQQEQQAEDRVLWDGSRQQRGAPPPAAAQYEQQLLAQQQALAEAAAAAAALGAPRPQQQHPAAALAGGSGSGGGPSGDSVAAALQRAVNLAAAAACGSAGSAGAGPSSVGYGYGGAGPGPGPGGSSYSSPYSVGLPGGIGSGGGGGGSSGAVAVGASRSGTLQAPLTHRSFHHFQQQPLGPVAGPVPPSGPLFGGAGVGGGGDSAWDGFSMLAERSGSGGRGGARHLPRLSEEVEGVRSSADVDVPLACKLDVVAGPCSNCSYTNTEDVLEIIIGRNQGATLQLSDGEISGQHAAVRWSSVDKCWKVADLGSLNGTLLNGEPISVAGRKRGRDYRLSSDDILQLGSFTKIKVSTFPRDLLDPMQSRCGSLPVGSMPKSLTMPKHRIPSFTSLLSPKITNTPSKKATVAAASDELRLECCIISRTGRDHMRKGQTCEDVACAECPLHGSEQALGGNPAALFCVFDGHCGRGAADAASISLPDEVSTRLEGVRDAMAAAAGAEYMLRDAFLATDEAISAEEGCTATAVLMWRDGQGAVCLQAANVGDSAALFIDPASQAVTELTEDHRLSNPRERQRLQDMGIQLASNARRLYGLNLSRGLGDKFLKDEDLGLSAEPYVSGVVRLSEQQGGILLIASDGLWDVADAEAVTQAICQADREKDGNVVEAANAVIGHALKQRTKDDVTALVVRVWPAAEWELRSPTKNLDDGEVASFVS